MRLLRRTAQAIALVATLLIGVVAVALIVSQTPWFKDWLRRYVMRESAQYLNGQLTIGRLGGNLLFGLDLADVAVEVSGEQVVAVKDLQLDYSAFDFVSRGLILDDIRITEPRLVLRRDEGGRWNLASLVKKQEREAGREGPARPVAIGSIGISNGQLTIDDRAAGDGPVGTAGRAGSPGVNIPDRIRKFDAKLSFHYQPVEFTLVMDHVSFRTESPSLDVNRIQGTVAIRDDDLFFETLKIHTAESAVNVDGAVEQYATKPVLKIEAASERLSLPEIARVAPAIGDRRLHPSFSVKARGPLGELALQLNARSEAGTIDAEVTVDAEGPQRAARGTVRTGGLNLAPLLDDPSQKSHITGTTRLDISVPAGGMDAARGAFAFAGPRVAVAGYEASDVNARGRIDGPRVTIDGRAHAYGGTATAGGVIVTPSEAKGRGLRFSLDGRAAGVNLRGLPARLNAPRLTTDLNATYHAEGAGRRVAGNARLDRSSVEGATIEGGTTASVVVPGPGRIEYAAQGGVSGLDVQRLGRGLRIAALSAGRFASDINAGFDVKGSGTSLQASTLDATGALHDSRVFGGNVPALDFEAHLAGGALRARAQGELAGFDPAALSGRPDLKGTIGGRVSVDATVADITRPIAPDAIDGTARVELARSAIAGLDLDGGIVDASVRDGVADLKDVSLEGPDLSLNARGRVALNDTDSSDLKYRLQAARLEEIGRVLKQPLQGSAIVDGTMTGNRSSLRIAGTLDGSNLAHGDNGALDVNSTFAVTLPNLRAADAGVEAQTEATFVKIGGLQIQEFTARTTYAGNTVGFDATVNDRGRQLQAKGDAILHPDHSEVHLPAFALRTQGVEWRLAGADAAIRYGGDRVSFQNVRLQNGAQILSVDGAIATTGEDKTGDVGIRAENVDLAQLQRLLLTDRGLKGQFSADARLTGSLSAPRVDGNIAIANGAFRGFTFDSLTSRVTYTSTGMTVDARLQQNAQQWLTVKGVAPMSLFRAEPTTRAEHVAATSADRVDLRVESSVVDLGVVQGFTAQVTNVAGTIQANVRVTGSGHDPHPAGTIAIRNGAFSLPVGGTSYTGLDTTLQLSTDKVVVPRFQVLDDHKNPLTVAGELAVHARSVGAVNVTVESDNFELIDNQLGDLGVDSRLRVTGELRRPRVEGEIAVENGRLQVDEILAMVADPYATELAEEPIEPGAEAAASAQGASQAAHRALDESGRNVRSEKNAEAAAAKGRAAPSGTLMDNLTLDVQVRLPDNLVLRGTDLRPGGPGGIALGDMNLTVGGGVRARKQPNDTVRLVGTVNTVRGFYEFQGRRFDVERDGRIRFVGLADPNPLLDLRATRIIDGVEARVHVGGTARAPELELSSNPPLDEADILSLIVFNQSINDLNEGERISLAQRAGAVAGGFVAAPLARSIGRALDVDLFEIQATDESGLLGPGITLGQQVSEHLFVKFHQQFGPQDTSEFILEYQIADFMRLRASGSPGDPAKANRVALRRVERAGADLIFFFSY
ncbi:MAG: translocation/assembly module TamB domain-containing protein [Acidobacteria bacterium]|nr:translocation/assembly module TamB domain-containing protein [Acidobacteriota bacterium]